MSASPIALAAVERKQTACIASVLRDVGFQRRSADDVV